VIDILTEATGITEIFANYLEKQAALDGIYAYPHPRTQTIPPSPSFQRISEIFLPNTGQIKSYELLLMHLASRKMLIRIPTQGNSYGS